MKWSGSCAKICVPRASPQIWGVQIFLRWYCELTRGEREKDTPPEHMIAFSQGAVRSHSRFSRSLTRTHSHLRMNQPGLYICNNVQCVCVLLRRPRRFIVIVCFAGLSPLAPSSLNVWALFSIHSSALERHKCFIYIQFLELTFKLWKIPGEVFRNAAHKKKLFKFKVFCSMFCSLN